MAKQTVAIDLQATTKGGESVKSLKQQIKEAQAEAIQLSRKFGDFSPEATKAAKRVAELKDEMGDFQQRVAALNPDKFQAIAGITQGIAGGISAMTGALALFGAESEETQKLMAKVQGAIAFSTGVQQILDLKNSFGAVATVIKNNVVAAFTTLKGAIMATGIGLVVTALAALIQHLEDTADAAEKAKRELEALTQFYDKVWKLDEQDLQIKLNKARIEGKSEQEMYQMRRRNIERRIEDLQYELSRGRDVGVQLADQKKQLEIFITENQAQEAERRRKLQEEANQKAIEEQRKHAEEMRKLQELEAEIQKDALKTNKTMRKQAQDEIEAADAEWLNNTQEAQIQRTTKFREEQRIKQNEYNAKRNAEEKAWNDERIANERAAEQQRVELSRASFQAIGDLAAAFAGKSEAQQRKAFQIQKAANIAQTIIDTITAAQGAYKSQAAIITPDAPIRAAIAAAIATAQGLARVAVIKRTQFGEGNMQMPTNANTPEGSFVPLTTGMLPENENAAGFAGMGKVYVLEGDITNTQRRVRRIRNVSVV